MKNRKLFADTKGWRTIRERIAYQNPHLEIFEETVATPRRPGGQNWTVAHRRAAAIIAPRTLGGRFILIRQERIPVRRELWEFPAGQIDDSHSPGIAQVKSAARRELREETGWRLARGGRLVPLGMFFTSPGFTSEHGYLFLAEPVEPDPSGHAHDEGEAIVEAAEFSTRQLRQMVADGEIRDANTLAVFARLSALGLIRR